MLKIIGAGLGRTGTTSLHEALMELGFSSLHFDEHRLNDVLDGSTGRPDFRRYDDVDAVCDVPSALFYSELMEAYPESKVVLTVRDVDGWWRSINQLFTSWSPVPPHPGVERQIARVLRLPLLRDEPEGTVFRRNLRYCAFGSPVPIEHLYKRAYLQHNAAVVARTPPDRLLVMDITAGDGWEKLCPFLGVPIPSKPFPSANMSRGVAATSGAGGADALPAPRRPASGRARRQENQASTRPPHHHRRGLAPLSTAAALLLVAACGMLTSSEALGCGWRCVLGGWRGFEHRASLWLEKPAKATSDHARADWKLMRRNRQPRGGNHTV